MTKLILGIAMAIVVASCGSNNETPTQESNAVSTSSYSIDTAASILNWKGSMVGMYAHTGTLKFKEGSLTLEAGKVIGGNFVVDMMSMLTTDDDALYKMAPREKLIGHLQADDFFSAATYPTARFEISAMEGNTLKGKLTIKGMTNEETVTDVVLTEANGNITATGKLVFDRQKYGVSYKATMKDMVLADDIELEISLTGIAK